MQARSPTIELKKTGKGKKILAEGDLNILLCYAMTNYDSLSFFLV